MNARSPSLDAGNQKAPRTSASSQEYNQLASEKSASHCSRSPSPHQSKKIGINVLQAIFGVLEVLPISTLKTPVLAIRFGLVRGTVPWSSGARVYGRIRNTDNWDSLR